MQSDASNSNASNAADKQLKSDQQMTSADDPAAANTDDVDQSTVSINSSRFSRRTSIDYYRRNSIARQNGGPTLIKRDALILLPEGGKNPAANNDWYPMTHSSRNSDNENSDTDVSEQVESVERFLYDESIKQFNRLQLLKKIVIVKRGKTNQCEFLISSHRANKCSISIWPIAWTM